MKKVCPKCKVVYYSKICPNCDGDAVIEHGICEMCGARGTRVAYKDKNGHVTGYVPRTDRDMVLCYGCYLGFWKQKGFNVCKDIVYTDDEIGASTKYHMAKFYGDKLSYCPFQRLNDKRSAINQEYWATFEERERDKLVNETCPKDWS